MLIMSMKSPYKSLGVGRRREKAQNHKELIKPLWFHSQAQIIKSQKAFLHDCDAEIANSTNASVQKFKIRLSVEA